MATTYNKSIESRPGASLMTGEGRGAILATLSDEEILQWILQFHEWPPIRLSRRRRDLIATMASTERMGDVFRMERDQREAREIAEAAARAKSLATMAEIARRSREHAYV